jgi:WD40 repeat protein
MPIWRFDSGWEAALNSTGSNDTIRLGSLFHSRAWHQLIPDEKHEIVVDGLGEFLGLDYLAAARTSDGVTVIAYLPSRRTFTVDLTKISGKAVAAWWFNPSSGKVIFAGQFPTIGKQEFTPAQEGDWVLVLDDADRHLPAPGQLK